MFGFLLPNPSDRQTHLRYRQIYAAFCAHHRARHGTGLSLLLSYEAIFLLVLAIESGGYAAPSAQTPRCCKLRSDPTNRWGMDRKLADYCSDFGVLLAKIKIEDDMRDHGLLRSRLAAWWFRKPFRLCLTSLEKIDPEIPSLAGQVVAAHLQLEKSPREETKINAYAAPTAEGFATLFAGLARSSRELSRHQSRFRKIGYSIGAAIVATDCCEDRKRDLQTGQFNPLKTRASFQAAREFALEKIAEAGFECSNIFVGDHAPSVLSGILNRAFQRIRRLKFESSTPLPKAEVTFNRLPISLQSALRQGDCDCGGCDGCDGNCDACGQCVGDPGGDCATGCVALGCSNCCDGCCEGSCKKSCDGCTAPNSKNEDDNAQSQRSSADTEVANTLIGRSGTCVGALAPMGVIIIAGVEHPAKSQSGFIEEGQLVTVIKQEAFGLLVKPAG